MSSQESLILQHLKTKPLTALDALFDYGCFRLAARVFDLRAKGYRIESREVRSIDRHGVEKRYSQYYLDEPF